MVILSLSLVCIGWIFLGGELSGSGASEELDNKVVLDDCEGGGFGGGEEDNIELCSVASWF